MSPISFIAVVAVSAPAPIIQSVRDISCASAHGVLLATAGPTVLGFVWLIGIGGAVLANCSNDERPVS